MTNGQMTEPFPNPLSEVGAADAGLRPAVLHALLSGIADLFRPA
jgi:hypothetical protein